MQKIHSSLKYTSIFIHWEEEGNCAFLEMKKKVFSSSSTKSKILNAFSLLFWRFLVAKKLISFWLKGLQKKSSKTTFLFKSTSIEKDHGEGQERELFEEVQFFHAFLPIFKANGRKSKSYTIRILIGKHLVLNKQLPSSMWEITTYFIGTLIVHQRQNVVHLWPLIKYAAT